MLKRILGLALLLALIAPGIVNADANVTYKGPLSRAEKTFVASIQSDLMARFPNPAAAEKAGYFRFTNADDTGSISYANLHWQSTDPRHPSQLWYDKDGNLLGADYSQLKTSNVRPHMFGVNPGRFLEIGAHIHWVSKGAHPYDNYARIKPFVAAGGNPQNPSVATLVAMKKVKDPSQVTKVFEYPDIWDLMVWVKHNPNGQFAYKNPDVKVTSTGSM